MKISPNPPLLHSSAQSFQRESVMGLLFDMNQHQILLSLQMPTVGDQQKTIFYLRGLQRDLTILEAAIQTNPSFQSLHHLFRKKKIEKDLDEMYSRDTECSPCDHTEHLNRISNQPHLVMAHLAVHYLETFSELNHLTDPLAHKSNHHEIHHR